MNKKRKFGILLILIGFGIPLVLLFFQDNGDLNIGNPTYKVIERKLTPTEIETIEEKIAARNSWLKNLENKETLEKNEYYIRFNLAVVRLDEMQSVKINKSAWTIKSKLILVIPYKYFVGIGILLIFIGMGMVIFSFFPKDKIEEEKKESQTE